MKLNLFELAEEQLQKEKKERIIPCYTMLDIIEYAVEIRKKLDDNPKIIKQAMKLTERELKKHKQNLRRQKYLRTGK